MRQHDPRARRHARLELLGLAVVTGVLLVGFWTTYRQSMTTVDETEAQRQQGTVVLPGTKNARELAAVLTCFPTLEERTFAASAVAAWIAEHGPLTHVGALAQIRVPSRQVLAHPRLTTLRDRLEARTAHHDDPRGTSSRDGRLRDEHALTGDVPLFTTADIAAIKPALVVRTRSEFARHARTAILIFLLAFWATHVARRVLDSTGDAVLLPSVQLLAGLGLMAMFSLRDPLRDSEAAGSVAIGIALGCALLLALSLVDFESPRLRFSTGLPLAGAVTLAALLLVFGTGPGTSGVKVNLWGGQPIEAIKLLAVFALAAYFSRRWETVRAISHSPDAAPYLRLPRWADVSPLVVIVVTLLAFFFLQRDLGPALVLGCLSLGLYGIARGRAALVLTGALVLVAGFAVGYELGFPATVARRVGIWIDPWENGLVGGDQIAHGLWALASGAVRGVGLGTGEGRLVPAGHTDLIVAVLGEELGLVGVLVVAAVYALLVDRMLRIATRAPGDYTMFLALGCALALAVPALVIVGGVFGVMPLSGVVTPFLSYGKSAMIGNIAAVGVALAIARRAGPIRPRIARQVRMARTVLMVALLVLAADATRIQAWQADTLAVRPSLAQQGDGVARYQYNPRLLLAMRRIPRGTIYDRNGFALATSNPADATAFIDTLQKNGLRVTCPPTPGRCYPLGGRAFHLLGDWQHQTNWNAPNASFLERDFNATLQGFDDRPQTVQRRARSGRTESVVLRDYRELLPLVRHRTNLAHPDVQAILTRTRDVTTSIDGVLQLLVARALEARVRAAGVERGAVVVIDPDTGELLASASYPFPDSTQIAEGAAIPPVALLDRPRYGLYPPGSTFKLITAAAALRSHTTPAFECVRLDAGRVGARVRGYGRPVRDDILDRTPHGHVDLHKGLVVSCNAYFGQLAVQVGPTAIAETAAATGIRVASEPMADRLRRTLPYAGYGQGEVVASPLRLARVVGAIATDGTLRDTRLQKVDPGTNVRSNAVHWLTPEQASFLATSMRDVVREGTGRVLSGHRVAIAGKTGTAELNAQPSHSWFVGFAPYATRGRRIAFAVLVENAGYGGRLAAPLAGDVVAAAQAAGVIR